MKGGFAGRIAAAFIDSRLTPLLMIAALLLGLFAVLRTPREEEPQIVVPMLDLFVSMPGASPQEVEQRVTIPMEKLLREIPGVEYIYSISQPGGALVIVRFYVGVKEEDAILRTYNKMYSNFDRIPPGVSPPLIKVRSIDDVPILALTLWGAGYDHFQLRRIAAELDQHVKQVEDVSETNLIGGLRRQLRVTLDPQRLAAFRLSPGAIVQALQVSNQRSAAGSFSQGNQEMVVEAGRFLRDVEEARRLVVGVMDGRPVYLRDVARVEDGPEEPRDYVLFGQGGAAPAPIGEDLPAVTLTIAKRKGTNATVVAERVLRKVAALRGYALPADVQVDIANDNSVFIDRSIKAVYTTIAEAVVLVTLVIFVFLRTVRASIIPLVTIPVSLIGAFALMALFGFSINTLTLLALVLAIGLLQAVGVLPGLDPYAVPGRPTCNDSSPSSSTASSPRSPGPTSPR
ncbi:MAG: efflux RND transporter permease subunit, partial [Firmicutes bacterium]|nr:efflux RND transporter permease subunit [Bacillota bacterium]